MCSYLYSWWASAGTHLLIINTCGSSTWWIQTIYQWGLYINKICMAKFMSYLLSACSHEIVDQIKWTTDYYISICIDCYDNTLVYPQSIIFLFDFGYNCSVIMCLYIYSFSLQMRVLSFIRPSRCSQTVSGNEGEICYCGSHN